jgi:CheY-like chemotaxis protein
MIPEVLTMVFVFPTRVLKTPLTWSTRASLRKVRRRKTLPHQGSPLPKGTSLPLLSQKPHIIVVDDEPAVAEIVCAILEDAHFRANACTYSPDAVTFIQINQPDVIILDVQMPHIDGVQLFKLLQSNADTRAIPVIFLSADASALLPYLSEYNAFGIRLLRKPFTGDELLALVTTVLQ